MTSSIPTPTSLHPPPPEQFQFPPGSSSDGGMRRRPVQPTQAHYDWQVTEGDGSEEYEIDPAIFEDERPSKYQEYLGIFFEYLFWVLLAYCAMNAFLWVGEKTGLISPHYDEWSPVRWWHSDPHGVQKELFANATSTAATAAQFAGLKKWIENGPGGWVSNKLELNDFLSEKGRYERRLELLDAVEKDEILVKLPISHVLSADFCQQDLTDQTIRQVVDAQKRSSEAVEIAPWTWITLYMVAHSKRDQASSPGGGRFDSLLKGEFVDAALSYIPLFWDDESLHWLNGTDLATSHLLDVHAAIETEYHKLIYLVSSIESTVPAIEFKKWAMVVMSRGETVELPDPKNKSKTTPQLAIMPLIDLVDHHLPLPTKPLFADDDLLKFQEHGSHTNISYDAEIAAVTLKAKEPLPAKTVVTVGYGVRSNADYLLYHGFAMPKEWSDLALCVLYAMVELPLPSDFPPWKSRHLAHPYRFALPACPSRKSTPHVAVGAARFLVASEDDVVGFHAKLQKDPSLLDNATAQSTEKFLQNAAQEAVSIVCDTKIQPPICRVPLSVESERAAWAMIKNQTLARVAKHVTTIDQDDFLLDEDAKKNHLTINQRHALIVRREEKLILRSWCTIVVRIVAFLSTPEGAESITTYRVPDEQVLGHEEPRIRPRYLDRLIDSKLREGVEAECASLR